MLMVPNRLRGAFAPIVATSFVNKCGSIGLNLLPMLLVARGVGPRPATIPCGVWSSRLGALSTAWGLTALILFDAATSLIAAAWAAVTLPKGRTSTWLADEAARAMPEAPPISVEPVSLASDQKVP